MIASYLTIFYLLPFCQSQIIFPKATEVISKFFRGQKSWFLIIECSVFSTWRMYKWIENLRWWPSQISGKSNQSSTDQLGRFLRQLWRKCHWTTIFSTQGTLHTPSVQEAERSLIIADKSFTPSKKFCLTATRPSVMKLKCMRSNKTKDRIRRQTWWPSLSNGLILSSMRKSASWLILLT